MINARIPASLALVAALAGVMIPWMEADAADRCGPQAGVTTWRDAAGEVTVVRRCGENEEPIVIAQDHGEWLFIAEARHLFGEQPFTALLWPAPTPLSRASS